MCIILTAGQVPTCLSVYVIALHHCLFLVSLGGNFFRKTYNFPPSPTAAKLCALNLFSSETVNYKYITETFF